MRLLLRANSHRPLTPVNADADGGRGGGFEIAASPDTPTRPDRWSWHIRVLEAKPGDHPVTGPAPTRPDAAAAENAAKPARFVEELIELGPGAAYRVLEIGYDPDAVTPEVRLLKPDTTSSLDRHDQDLTVVLVTAGGVRVENRHDLTACDVLVLAGDDPMNIDFRSLGATGDLEIAVVTLRAPNNAGVPWVP